MRVAEFDREYVLRQAMLAFTQFGYAKTSMQKLVMLKPVCKSSPK